MLQTLRKGAGGWVAKTLLGILVLSFGAWGIADVFQGNSNQAVAEVGGREISVDSFRSAYQEQMRRIGQQRGRPLSVVEAQALGVGRSVLTSLVAEAVLDERAAGLGLSLTDDLLARQIRENPSFRGPAGSFDRVRFAQIIRANGMTENQFLATERDRSEREQLIDALTGELSAPKILQDGLNRYLSETRAVDYVLVTPADVKSVPEATDAELRTYYDEHKIAFRAPEFRKIALLQLEPASLAAAQQVSDEDAQRVYQARKADYSAPEKRNVQQISFPSDAEAAEAAAKISAGTSFADLATQRGLTPADYDLGTVEKSAMFDPIIAEAAFSLAEGTTSAPVKGSFGTVILHIAKVEPGQDKPFSELRDAIVGELQLQRARDALLDSHDKIEDARAGGETLAEIAPKFVLPLQTVDRIDRQGRDPGGTVLTLPEADKLLSEAFAADPGVETESLNSAGGGYLWYEVQDVVPSRDRSFEEARADVLSSWLTDERRRLAGTEATAMLDALKQGKPLAEVAAAAQLNVKTAEAVTRSGSPPDIGRGAANAIFSVAADGGVGTAPSEEPSARIVFRVTASRTPPLEQTAQASQAAAEQLRQGLVGDIGVQYLQGAQNEIGVTYNTRNIDSVVGVPES